MQIILKSLALKNFKGVRDLTIEFNDTITNIFGKNATGKTTLFDAYSWLLWDKDSVNRSDFGIKTYSETGEALHGLDHSVEGVLEVDGKTLRLKKVYFEKWTKKRGQIEEIFSGNTARYYMNDMLVQKKQYQDRIGSIIQEDLFKLLSNPAHFSVALDKNKRREILLTLVKDVSDADIIAENPHLSELKDLMQDYRIDELRAMKKAQASKLNKEIQELPIRIDELSSMKKTADFAALSAQLDEKRAEMEQIDRVLTNENAQAAAYFERLNEIQAIEAKAFSLKAQAEQEAQKKRLAVSQAANTKKAELENLKFSIEQRQKDIERAQSNISSLEAESEAKQVKVVSLRSEYEAEAKKEYTGEMNCPTCGQEFPQSRQTEILEAFHLQKSMKLENIVTTANAAKAEILHYAELIAEQRQKIEQILHDMGVLELRKNALEIEISGSVEIADPPVDMSENLEYAALTAEIEQKKAALKNAEKPNTDELKAKKMTLSADITAIEGRIAWQDENRRIDEKIAEYAAQEKALSQQYAACEKVLFLCEEFVKAKVAKISGSINSLFDAVEFKLFDTQVNGAIVETCEATINGVPFSDANNAARINAGIDIINTLSRLYGIATPIFVDNAESVNRLQPTASQVIRLIVSEDEALTIR